MLDELGWDDVQLFAHIISNADPVLTTARADLLGIGHVQKDLFAGEVIREGLAAMIGLSLDLTLVSRDLDRGRRGHGVSTEQVDGSSHQARRQLLALVPEDVPFEKVHLLLEVLNLFFKRGVLVSKLIV
jgi:hypothetical protein